MKRKSKFSRFMRSALAFALTASCCSGICLSNISCGEKFDPVAEIVNKDGVDAVVTYVIDDGNKPTGTFAREMLDKYQYLTVSFAVWTKDFATLKELPDGSQYVMAGNKYTYTQTDAQVQNVNFWNDILSGGRCELISHTHTHNFWGTNDDGGTFQYVKNNESNVLTATMPKGSVSKEVYGSNQILKELFPSSDFPTQSYLGLITPGIGVRTADFTTNDGKVIPTYNTYFLKLMQQAIQRGEYIAARGTFQTTNTKDSSSRVITPSKLEKLTDRMNVPAYMIVTENRNSSGSATEGGIENWTAYIDHAIEQKGWACYCIHNIHENVTDHAGHKIDERDAEELFAYTADKSVWVAT
ncbi:MAG: hypothetical protein IKB34_08310, partial [Clostridia bacterium]|nr:hypothetical protein [Clostridia bacterium]